ncbi:MAG: hypothetical protein H6767_02810 [Candidatus Peribacteria bacterium]|nr:MAG: hypothetical protein H6767_02810 [Candidatus Peribacteria bacterium]
MAKTYIDGASCKAVNGQFGEFFNISFNYERLEQYVNEKGYINMTMSRRKEPGQYGDTHYFTLNDWSPEGGNSYQGTASQNGAPQ